ncbi:MAG: TatD family hydrolase [Candidatus Sumerlaeota bacterium]|nr:TatD family hydrolase [Candidatus Sumerlaeota bacterium]
MLIDTHAHLTSADFSADLGAVLERARAAGVERIIAVADSIASSAACLGIAGRHSDFICASAGVHPHRAGEFDAAAAAWIREAARRPECVAIGEIGLDYHYDFSPPDAQRAAFATQLDLARELNLPAIIHCREAWDDVFALLREHPLAAGGGVMHCFTGSSAEAQAALESGLFLGVGGIVTFKKAGGIREAIAGAPLDRLVLETDAPYLAPIPHRGKRNEPAFTRAVAEFLARERNLPLEAIAAETTANAIRLFSKISS